MNTGWVHLPFLLLFILCQSGPASAAEWTEKKLTKTIAKAEKAADRGKWTQAIKYGEQALETSKALRKPGDAGHLATLTNLNIYYDKAGRLKDASNQIEAAYSLSKRYLGVDHPTTRTARTLLYKLSISLPRYDDAISLVLETISVLGEDPQDLQKMLHYLKQLYSLYGLTGQLEKEEAILLRYLDLEKRLNGSNGKTNIKVIQNLANNYCLQKKLREFYDLISQYQLKFTCE